MKKNKTFIILVIALVVCILLYTVVLLISKKNSQNEEQNTEENNILDSIAWQMDTDDLNEFSYTVGEGENFETIILKKKGDKWVWKDDETIPIYDYITNILTGYVCYLPSEYKLKDITEEDFVEFGLDKPSKVVKAKSGDTELQINFGRQAYNSTYYATINGNRNTVYLIRSDIFDYFDTPLLELVNLYTLPSLTEKTMYRVTVSNGEKNVVCTYYPKENEKYPYWSFKWYLSIDGAEEFPIDANLADNLTALLCGLEFLKAYSLDEADMAEYGIDGTTTLEIEFAINSDGSGDHETFIINLGNTDEFNYYYASVPGSPVTYLLGGSAYYKLLNFEYEKLAPAQITYFEFSKINNMNLSFGKQSVEIRKNITEESTTYTVNGKEINYSELNDLITALKTLTAKANTQLADEDGNLPVRDEGLNNELVAKLDFNFDSSDSVSTLNIYAFNSEYNLVSFFGRETQLISVKDTETFINIFTELTE